MTLYRKILVFGLLVVCSVSVFAFSTSGYIITINSDTIYGQIQLSHFNQVTGGLVLNGIEEESFHSRVVFAKQNEKRFQTYFPEMLLGFGFRYGSINYTFQQAIIQHKSIFKSENFQTRFVRVLYRDSIKSLAKDLFFTPNPGLKSNNDKYLKYNSYIFNARSSAGKPDTLKIQKITNIK